MNTLKEQYIAEGAIVKGNVKLGKDVSVWYHATIRGDSNSITIGDETNIQDNVVVHTENTHSVTIGNGVTIGHSAVVHGCLIGMGAIVLNGAVIGKDCIIGAGALVTQNTHIPDGSLAFGNPAKVIRQVTEEEKAANRANALKYVNEAKEDLANSINV